MISAKMKLIICCFIAFNIASCSGFTDCDKISKEVESKVESFSISKDDVYLDSILVLLNQLESKKCKSMHPGVLERKIAIFLLRCEWDRGLMYMENKDENLFSYQNQKEVYTNLFEALIYRDKGDSTKMYKHFIESSEIAWLSYVNHTIDFDYTPLVDYFDIKMYYQSKDKVYAEIDSLALALGDEAITALIETFEHNDFPRAVCGK